MYEMARFFFFKFAEHKDELSIINACHVTTACACPQVADEQKACSCGGSCEYIE
jgi:hypothetical protein